MTVWAPGVRHRERSNLWMPFIDTGPRLRSTLVMIGQNRQAAFQQIKADHRFIEQELELKTNTELTRAIHVMTTELRRRLIEDGAKQ